MVTHVVSSSDSTDAASGPVTAEERAARWGHSGGVLQLQGPAEAIDAVERSLFTAGAISIRIETSDPTFAANKGLLDLAIQSNTRGGLIALVVTQNDSSTLTARADDRELTLDAMARDNAVAAVQQLLTQAGILHTSGKAAIQ